MSTTTQNNWPSFVNNDSAKRFVLPEGWDSRDTVAKSLECSPDRVRTILAPAIREGSVLTKQFKVWDRANKRPIQVTAYKKVRDPK